MLLVYRKSKLCGIKTSMMEPFFLQFEFYSSREFDTLSKRAMQFVLIKMLNKWDSSYDDNNVGN